MPMRKQNFRSAYTKPTLVSYEQSWSRHCRDCKEHEQSNGAAGGKITRAYVVVTVGPGKSRDVAPQITSLPGVKPMRAGRPRRHSPWLNCGIPGAQGISDP